MTMAKAETAMTVALRAIPILRWVGWRGGWRWPGGRRPGGRNPGSPPRVTPAVATGLGSVGGPHGSAIAGVTGRGPAPIGRARALTGARGATAAHGTKMTPHVGQFAPASDQHQRHA